LSGAGSVILKMRKRKQSQSFFHLLYLEELSSNWETWNRVKKEQMFKIDDEKGRDYLATFNRI